VADVASLSAVAMIVAERQTSTQARQPTQAI